MIDFSRGTIPFGEINYYYHQSDSLESFSNWIIKLASDAGYTITNFNRFQITFRRKLMDFSTYRELALRSCKMYSSLQENFNHGVIGLITELGELADTIKRNWVYGKDLDIENIKEELGDFCWYFALTCKTCQIPSNQIGFDREIIASGNFNWVEWCKNILKAINDLDYAFEDAPRYDGGKDFSQINLDPFDSICIQVKSACFQLNIKPSQIFEANIQKLMKRYPDGYKDQDALLRRDKNEQQNSTNKDSSSDQAS